MPNKRSMSGGFKKGKSNKTQAMKAATPRTRGGNATQKMKASKPVARPKKRVPVKTGTGRPRKKY